MINPSDFQKLTAEQLWFIATHWTVEQRRTETSKLDAEQLYIVISAASEEYDPKQWQQKTRAIIEGLKDPHQIEVAGRAFSIAQIHEVLSAAASTSSSIQEKLFPLFIGIPHATFQNLLIHTSPEQLALLKQQSITEPIQHHLTFLSQELAAEMAKCTARFSSLEYSLERLDLSGIEASQVESEERKIEDLREACSSIQFKTALALSIAWNTNRTDLIDRHSKLKEQSQRFIQAAIGEPRTNSSEPSGLYLILEKHLNSVFCNLDSLSEADTPQDDEPAMEALIRFAVWYLHDYLEIGLLPHLRRIEDLELSAENHSEEERLAYREKLFTIVKKNLELIGLSTLADLKKTKIYSKKALMDYIGSHQGKLSPIV